MCDEVPWFTLQVLGRNTLGSMVKKMFEQIGVEGKTNHSLRATGATRLFEANVPEKLIKEKTGLRNVESLRLSLAYLCDAAKVSLCSDLLPP